MIPSKTVKGIGRAMDLVAGVKKIIVAMSHNSKADAARLTTIPPPRLFS